MPTYVYRCSACQHEFERDMKVSEHDTQPNPRCPKCNSERVERVLPHVSVMTSKKS